LYRGEIYTVVVGVMTQSNLVGCCLPVYVSYSSSNFVTQTKNPVLHFCLSFVPGIQASRIMEVDSSALVPKVANPSSNQSLDTHCSSSNLRIGLITFLLL
jgi:hypothetical protein